MTRQDIREAIVIRLGETVGSELHWPQAELNDAIDEGYKEVAIWSQALEKSDDITLDNTSTLFDLPSDFFLPIRMSLRTPSVKRLYPATLHDLDIWKYTWPADARAEPSYYYILGQKIGFYPPSNASGSVKAYYVYIPPSLSTDGTTPDFPEEYHHALVEYGYYMAKCKDDGEELEKGFKAFTVFLEIMKELKEVVYQRTVERDLYIPVTILEEAIKMLKVS